MKARSRSWHETKEDDNEKKDNEKTDRWRVTFSANIGRAIVDWRRSQRYLIGGESDSKTARRQLEELQRHDRAMEQGSQTVSRSA